MPKVRKADVVWVRPELVCRGRVRRVDARRPAARAVVPGAARGQVGARGAPRGAAPDRAPQGQARRSSSRTSTRSSSRTTGSRRATCSRYYRAVAPVAAAAHQGPAVHDEALPRRDRRAATSSRRTRRSTCPTGSRRGAFEVSTRERAAATQDDPGAARQRRARAALDGEHGLHRPEHVVLAGRQARAARTSSSSTSTRPPTPGFPEVVEVALLVKQVLDALGLVGFPKTSGSDGMHVLVPVERRYTYERHARVRRDRRRHARAYAPRAGHDRVDEGEAPRRPDRREPERRGEDDRVGLLGAAAPGRAGLDAAALGRGARGARPARASRSDVALGRIEQHGDLFEGVLTTRQRLGPRSSIAAVKLAELVADLDALLRRPGRPRRRLVAGLRAGLPRPVLARVRRARLGGALERADDARAEDVERAVTCVFPSDRIVEGLRRRRSSSPSIRWTSPTSRASCRSPGRRSRPCGSAGSASTTPTRRSTCTPRSRRRGSAREGVGLESLEEYFPICEGIPGGAASSARAG